MPMQEHGIALTIDIKAAAFAFGKITYRFSN